MKALSGLQGPRVKGIKGSWVPVDPKVFKGSKGLKGIYQKFIPNITQFRLY